MVKFKSIPVGPFKTIAEYEDMKAEMKRVKDLIAEFESGILKHVGEKGGKVKFSDGVLEINPFGQGEGRANPKYKPMWLDLVAMIETATVWNTSKEDMINLIEVIEKDNTNNADVQQKIVVQKDVKTVKAKTAKV